MYTVANANIFSKVWHASSISLYKNRGFMLFWDFSQPTADQCANLLQLLSRFHKNSFKNYFLGKLDIR